jgi:hypothetical protein
VAPFAIEVPLAHGDDKAPFLQVSERTMRGGLTDAKGLGRFPDGVWNASVVRPRSAVAGCYFDVDRSGNRIEALPGLGVENPVVQPNVPRIFARTACVPELLHVAHPIVVKRQHSARIAL